MRSTVQPRANRPIHSSISHATVVCFDEHTLSVYRSAFKELTK